MNVLGLSFDFHDASAALVRDGTLIASCAEERFTRNKHDAFYPRHAIRSCLQAAGMRREELDFVAFYENPVRKWVRVVESTLRRWPEAEAEFVASQSEWMGRKLWVRALLEKELGLPAERILMMDHHRSHAAQAFCGSGFESAAVLTIDAVGERATTSIHRARWTEGRGLELERLWQQEYPESLGLFYSAVTAFLGFKPMNDECTTMALATFGRPVYLQEFERVLECSGDGNYRLLPGFLDLDRFLSEPFTERWTELLGKPFERGTPVSASCFRSSALSPEEQRRADVACSVQAVLEKAILGLARRARAMTGQSRLCYAGGVALNCKANSRMIQSAGELGFEEIFIPVEPGDGGAAIGAAFLSWAERAPGAGRVRPYSVYQGQSWEREDLLPVLERLDVSHLAEYRSLAAATGTSIRDWRWRSLALDEERVEFAARVLAEGKVLGLSQGRFELGPRALGARSILFRPDRVELARRVNREIKERAECRPYALALREERARDVLELGSQGAAPRALKWMQTAAEARPELRPVLEGGLHRDGTTRPQLVGPEELPLLHAILARFEALTGVPALINTSFNEAGYPLVNHPLDALHIFARTELDALLIEGLAVEKH